MFEEIFMPANSLCRDKQTQCSAELNGIDEVACTLPISLCPEARG